MTALLLLTLALVIWSIYSQIKLKHKVEDLHFEFYSVKNRLENAAQQLDAVSHRVNHMVAEQNKDQGKARFTAEMTMADALNLHPGAIQVLSRFNLSGCSMCGSVDAETLAQAAQVHNFKLDDLLDALNALE